VERGELLDLSILSQLQPSEAFFPPSPAEGASFNSFPVAAYKIASIWTRSSVLSILSQLQLAIYNAVAGALRAPFNSFPVAARPFTSGIYASPRETFNSFPVAAVSLVVVAALVLLTFNSFPVAAPQAR
jgi:hypothetical protein